LADIITPPADPDVVLRAEAVDLVAAAVPGGARPDPDRPGPGGAMVVAGPVSEVLTTELVSICFDYPIAIARHAGRWASITR